MNLCFICDNNFVVTTKAAINSLVQTQTEDLKIYVIGIELSDESAGQFAQFSSPNVVIEVIRQDNLFSHIKHTHPNISTAVFFKFMIAKLLKEDKVLYLDGDVIVTDNIADFYSTNLENYYAAVVSDFVIEKEKNEPEKPEDITTVTKTISDFITKKPKTKVIIIRNAIIKNLIEDMPKNILNKYLITPLNPI